MSRALVAMTISFALTLCLAGLDASGETVFPEADWQQASPESQRVSATKLQAAIDSLEQNAGRDGVTELVVIRNGRMIWRGPSIDKVHGIWSCTKSFTSTVLGLLVDDGKCTVDTLAKEHLPELAKAYSTVSLGHFATMTSGYRAVGDEPRGSYRHGPSTTPFRPFETPLFSPPGSVYAYWDSAMNEFGHVLSRIAGQSLAELFQQRIADPIGMNPDAWKWGDFGQVDGIVVNGGSGNSNNHVFISAREMARFGHLFLNRGRWAGRQLISESWVESATRTQVPAGLDGLHPDSGADGRGVYGLNWWTNGVKPNGQRKWPAAPAGTFAASGYNNNDMFIIPEWNMVIVRLGLDQNDIKITDEVYSGFLAKIGGAILDPVVEGPRKVWHPITVSLRGPSASEDADAPNPFLDYRLQVIFSSPSGRVHDVPGFFAGDGQGGSVGNVWQVRFTPDEPGDWSFRASFRAGENVAVSLAPDEGEPTACDGQAGHVEIAPRDPDAEGFRKWGRLEYVGQHYLKFRDGPYWIRGGTDSPENLLAYAGFDNTPPSHLYADHVPDWQPGDPDWRDGQGRGILGAINYLSSRHVNSIYFLTMNVGGDGGDVWPWVGSPKPSASSQNDDLRYDNLHFDISKLEQWRQVFDHAQRQGIFLHFVLNEAEAANKRELDEGELGTERKLYYRELIARFGHYLALEWNLCEEYNLQFDFGPQRVRAFADYIQRLDPDDHPITVHSAGDPLEKLRFTFGDERFSLTSIQLNQRPIHEVAEAIRTATAEAGRPLPVSLDEFTVDRGQDKSHIPVDDADGQRKEKLWPTYLSGGMIEFILEDLLQTDSFKTPQREALWDYVWHARRFMQQLPFWEMAPADNLMDGAGTISVGTGGGKSAKLGAQVFAKKGAVYAVYLPIAESSGALDLSHEGGRFRLRWYNPRTGVFTGEPRWVESGKPVPLGTPPSEVDQDWAVLIEKSEASD